MARNTLELILLHKNPLVKDKLDSLKKNKIGQPAAKIYCLYKKGIINMFKQYKNSKYDIYDDGRCFSHLSNKFLTPRMLVKYPTYNLTLPEGKKKVKIHRMVAETFIPNPNNLPVVNHKDGDTHNFHFSNLEWVTEKENSHHARQTGLIQNGSQTLIKLVENLPGEDWKQIKDYPNYAVSNKGRVINLKTKRLIKQSPNNSGGYMTLCLWKNNKQKHFLVHRLVYMNFNNDYDLEGFVINHKDGNKVNNNLENLEKITYQENNLHAVYEIKTNTCAKKVAQYTLRGELVNTYPSFAEAMRQTGINNISRAVRNNTTAGGYKWKTID